MFVLDFHIFYLGAECHRLGPLLTPIWPHFGFWGVIGASLRPTLGILEVPGVADDTTAIHLRAPSHIRSWPKGLQKGPDMSEVDHVWLSDDSVVPWGPKN